MDVLDQLRKQGFRISKFRKSLLNLLANSGRAMTAPEILGYFSGTDTDINKSTVYRELEFLKKQGIIRELQLNEDSKRYEFSADHHHHLVCTNCAKIEHVELTKAETAIVSDQNSIEAKSRFKITRHELDFYGLCQNCQ